MIESYLIFSVNSRFFFSAYNDYLGLFSDFYYPLAYSILQSLAVFSATAAFQFPMFHSRWFTPFRWWIYLISCHALTVFIVIGGMVEAIFCV
jgi:hypothetical protein